MLRHLSLCEQRFRICTLNYLVVNSQYYSKMKAWVVLFFCIILASIHLSTSRHSVATGGLVEDEEKTVNESHIAIPNILNKFKITSKKSTTTKKLKNNVSKKLGSSIMLYTTGDKNNVWNGDSNSEKKDKEKESKMSDSSSNDQSSMSKDDSKRNSTSGQKNHGKFYRRFSVRHNFKKLFKRHGRNMNNSRRHRKRKFMKTESSFSNSSSKNDDNDDGKSSNDQSQSSKADHDHDSQDGHSGQTSRRRRMYLWYLNKKHNLKKYFKKHLENYHRGNSTLNASGEIKRKKLSGWISQKKKDLGQSWKKHGPALKKYWHSNRRKIKVMLFSLRMWLRYHRRPKINGPNMPSADSVGTGMMNQNSLNVGNNWRAGGRRRH